MTCREGHPPRHPDFTHGNKLGLRHGGFDRDRIGERATVIAAEVLDIAPHLAQAEFSFAVQEYAMARAQAELLTVAIEEYIKQANVAKLNARLIEAANSSRREAAAQRASLGLDPRSLAELRQIMSLAELNEALVNQIIPELPVAIAEALEAIGAPESATQFTAVFVAALQRGGDNGAA